MTKLVNLKVGNMRDAQEFILYPYQGGDIIHLQSDKRWITADLRSGRGMMTSKNRNHATSWHLTMGSIAIELPEDVKIDLQSYVWHNSGTQNLDKPGIVKFVNQELFSVTH